jgi:aspartokinase-like uncharacterized kinase
VDVTVVKLGGSYARFAGLLDLLSQLQEGAGRTVVVPGGGPFADCIRREQARLKFNDRAAHRMALLAMAQFGYALAGLSTALPPAGSIEMLRGRMAEGKVPVWLPLELLDGRPDIPEEWSLTSDSLAAWLAERLSAQRLIFVKRVAPRSAALSSLVASGVLDPLVPSFLARSSIEAWIYGPRHIIALGEALAGSDGRGGRRIRVA